MTSSLQSFSSLCFKMAEILRIKIIFSYCRFLVAQWIECPPGFREVMGSIPVGDSHIFSVPRSCHVDQLTFHISLPSLKFTIFIHLLQI